MEGSRVLRHPCHLAGDVRHSLIYVVNLSPQVVRLTSEAIDGGGAEEEGSGLTIFSKCHFNQQETKIAHR